MYGDLLYWMMLGPMVLFALYAQIKVQSAFSRFSRVPAAGGMTGAEAAGRLLAHAGLAGKVKLEQVGGFLSDHYDPRKNVLRLSPQVYSSNSIAAVGVACHEAGHAIQHAQKYAPAALRAAIVPVAGFGSWISWPMIILGMVLQWRNLALLGLLFFAAIVFFQIVNLPVEFNASSRAKAMMAQLGIVRGEEQTRAASAVLDAAALTYVAATAQAVMQLLYFAIRLGLFGRRSD
jgi:Zn-dependent membrane protease YugP